MPKVLLYFLTSRLIFIFFAYLATFIVPLDFGYIGKQFDPSAPYPAWVWANFDGRHYLEIADRGYGGVNFAYFPLYPLSIKILSQILPIPLLYVGIIISIISFLLAIWLLYKIILLDFNQHVAQLTLLLIFIFPLSFFYHSVYADSLFLLFSTASFYFARKRQWILAGVFGLFSVLDRLAGIALIFALFTEWYLQNKKIVEKNIIQAMTNFIKTGAWAVGLTGAGLLLYMAYLQIYFGNAFLFQKSMAAWRQSEFVFPFQVIFRYLKIFFLVDKSLLVFWVALLEFISVALYFALTWFVGTRIRLSYGVLLFGVFLLPTFTGTFAGVPRYILHTFPGFLAIALLLQNRNILRKTTYIIFLILGFIFTALFTRGYFIA